MGNEGGSGYKILFFDIPLSNKLMHDLTKCVSLHKPLALCCTSMLLLILLQRTNVQRTC